jgi:ceramide glucosyltransferase
MTIVPEILLTLLSYGAVLYYLAGAVLTIRFFGRPRSDGRADQEAGDRKAVDLGPVSVLVPVAGLDAGAAENWCSLCRQDYPQYEVLFGVTDAGDPAVPTLREVVAAHPDRARLFVGLPPRGANFKDSNLSYLLEEARHELIVLADSDLRVKPDYLRTVITPLADPAVGMVTCAFVGRRPQSLGAALASLGRCTEFVPGLLLARALDGGLRCAVGATMAMRRDTLAAAGGLHMNRIGSDFNLGRRVARIGYGIELSREVLESDTGSESVAAVFRRELRWARTIRFNRGPLYYAMIFCYGTVFSLALLLVSGPVPWAIVVVAVTFLARYSRPRSRPIPLTPRRSCHCTWCFPSGTR